MAHKWAGWLQTPYRLGVPTASVRGTDAAVAHKWAGWLQNPCRLGGPKHFRAGDKISGLDGYIALATLGVPNALGRGTQSIVAHKWAGWLHNPCSLGGPQCRTAEDRISSGPQMGRLATKPLQAGGVPNALERGMDLAVAHKWAGWLHNPCRPGERGGGGTKASGREVAHKWARRLQNPCRPGDPQHFRAGDRISSGPQVGHVATQSLLLVCGGGGGGQRFTAGDRINSGPQVGRQRTLLPPFQFSRTGW